MFDTIVEQFKNAMKPASELMSLNAKAVELLMQQQAALVTTSMNETIALSKELMEQKDFSGVFKTQKEYLSGMKDTLVSTSKESYSVLTDTQEKAGELLKGAFTAEIEAVKTAASKVTAKKPAAAA